MLTDQKTEVAIIPLNSLPSEGRLEIASSPLSEFAVLGFETGMSWTNPKLLNLWEAQFGVSPASYRWGHQLSYGIGLLHRSAREVNMQLVLNNVAGAQIIIDNFLASGESKWAFQSALTLLLPHGYDGAGPEHSSARIERFLQMTSDSLQELNRNPNMHVAQPTTASQYFHVLRRQMLRNYRKPLVLFTPKSTLRLPATTSALAELEQGSFSPILVEPSLNNASLRRVVFLSGQLYYKLVTEREKRGLVDQISFIRVEVQSLCFSSVIY